MAGGTVLFNARDSHGFWQLFTLSWDGRAMMTLLQEGRPAYVYMPAVWQAPLKPSEQLMVHLHALRQRPAGKGAEACPECVATMKDEKGTIHFFKFCPDCGRANFIDKNKRKWVSNDKTQQQTETKENKI